MSARERGLCGVGELQPPRAGGALTAKPRATSSSASAGTAVGPSAAPRALFAALMGVEGIAG